MMKKSQQWKAPGWPWELEIIIVLFVAAALAIPLQLVNVQGSSARPLGTEIGFLKAAMVVALYVLHVAFGFIHYNRLTVSLVHFLSPVFFAYIAYHRIVQSPGVAESAYQFLDGAIWQYAAIGVIVPALTLLLMHMRRLRYLNAFKDTVWELDAPAVMDQGYFTLLGQMMPLFYPPARYRVCAEGLLVEGWHYAMPVSFKNINRIMRIPSSSVLPRGYYLASSTTHLVRIDLLDSIKPLFISPQNPDGFAAHCQQHTGHRRSVQTSASSTRHGAGKTSSSIRHH